MSGWKKQPVLSESQLRETLELAHKVLSETAQSKGLDPDGERARDLCGDVLEKLGRQQLSPAQIRAQERAREMTETSNRTRNELGLEPLPPYEHRMWGKKEYEERVAGTAEQLKEEMDLDGGTHRNFAEYAETLASHRIGKDLESAKEDVRAAFKESYGQSLESYGLKAAGNGDDDPSGWKARSERHGKGNVRGY